MRLLLSCSNTSFGFGFLIFPHNFSRRNVSQVATSCQHAIQNRASTVRRLRGIFDIKLHLQKLSESQGVVVSHRLGIAKGLQQGMMSVQNALHDDA